MKSVGKVEMTIEAYNELMTELMLMRQGVKVFKASWDENRLEVEFDTKLFSKEIQRQIDNNYPGFVMNEYLGTPSTNIAKLDVVEE